MKKILFIPLMLLYMLSCTNLPSTHDADDENMDFEQKYNSSRSSAHMVIEQMLDSLNWQSSRSGDTLQPIGDALLYFLASLPVDSVDSLYQIYCTPAAKESYVILSDSVENFIISTSSLDEFRTINDFTDKYIECGGHNMQMIKAASSNKSQIIRDCIISSAGAIDEFGDVSSIRTESIEWNSYCLNLLARKFMRSFAEGAIINTVTEIGMSTLGIPGVDLATALVLAGVDLYSALELVHEYNLCCLSHIS